MHKKFENYRTKIKGSCQSGRKMVTHDSKSDLPQEYVQVHRVRPYDGARSACVARATHMKNSQLGALLVTKKCEKHPSNRQKSKIAAKWIRTYIVIQF